MKNGLLILHVGGPWTDPSEGGEEGEEKTELDWTLQ